MLLAILPDMVVWLFMIRIFLLMQWWVAYHRNRRRSCCFISCPSSLRNQNFPPDLIFFWREREGPAGEICGGVGKHLQIGQEHLREAAKHGFKLAQSQCTKKSSRRRNENRCN